MAVAVMTDDRAMDLHHLYLWLRKCRQFGAYTDSIGIGPFLIDYRLHEVQARWRVLIRPAKPHWKFYNEVVI